MSESGNKVDFKKFIQASFKALKHLFLHNGWLKLISILISLVLWAGLISQDASLTRDKTFQNVNVNIIGNDTLINNGFIVVSNLDDLLNDVTVVAAVPQLQYENAESSAYNIRLDLSRITGSGEQEVKLLYSNSTTLGKIVSINPSSVTINVEDYSIRQRIPVSTANDPEAPEGWYVSPPTVDPALIAVSGPRSLVQTISRARAFIDPDDVEWKEGQISTIADLKLYNRQGEEVNSPLLNMSSSNVPIDTVIVDMNVLPCVTFKTSELVQINGEVAPGYQKKVKISPETITVAARQEVLDQMEELSLERNNVNIDNMDETSVVQLKVQKPSEDAILSNDTITVTVEIEPIEQSGEKQDGQLTEP